MNKEGCLKYLHLLLTDAQHVRSVAMEGGATADVQQHLNIEPWVYGKNNLVTILPGAIERFESGDDLMDLRSTVMNFSHIARSSRVLGIAAVNSKRHDPTVEEIFEVESQEIEEL